MSAKLAGLLAVVLGVIAALGVGLAAAQNSGVEARIEARRLEDGRIEFALRERGGDRILPPARYFPAETEAGRWLSASWISVGEDPILSATPVPERTDRVPIEDVVITGLNCALRSYGAPYLEVQFTPKRSGNITITAFVRIEGRKYYANAYVWGATAGVPTFDEVIFSNAPQNPRDGFRCEVVSIQFR